ncbi:DGQHR domain-containing protein DpdB [Rubellimicrobium roseum]|uniref:DGQHR domain-containing protein n=1 Tax=Rubellimicrobium roseum TaxID=687525 RepID=A0A5C4NHQ0_9RHOB|nr:DGQHR domain-containing protein DpdB [Rubellimicrobium roseum]TNC74354.1 DGQHR domain-containing protein [Rubellimicrobium roseum]
MNGRDQQLVVRAVKAQQGEHVNVFAFFLYGSDITRIADISRITRDEGELKGFQRREIREHVNAIVEFLDSGPVLFPNAVILALSSEAEFRNARGSKPDGMTDVADVGTLSIPIRPEGQRAAWIVDGQQRSLALARSKNSQIAVPVVAFVSPDLETQREQFILVNKAKPLPTRLINELLPEVASLLPRDLAARRLPSELCNALNRDPRSPFFRLIKRASDTGDEQGVVTDTALVEAIRLNLKPPLGALSQYKPVSGEGGDAEGMLRALILYWSAVKETFPEAWGQPATEGRLMHSAGIRVMGALMDQIMLRADSSSSPETEVRDSLARLAPHCCWTSGVWEGLGWQWNEVQSTRQHISRLTEHLTRLDRDLARPVR